jgi:hypothetical protein
MGPCTTVKTFSVFASNSLRPRNSGNFSSAISFLLWQDGVQEGQDYMTLDDFKAQMLREEGLLGKNQNGINIVEAILTSIFIRPE